MGALRGQDSRGVYRRTPRRRVLSRAGTEQRRVLALLGAGSGGSTRPVGRRGEWPSGRRPSAGLARARQL